MTHAYELTHAYAHTLANMFALDFLNITHAQRRFEQKCHARSAD